MKTKNFKPNLKRLQFHCVKKKSPIFNDTAIHCIRIAYYRFFQPILVSVLIFCILFHFFYVGCFNLCFYSIQHLGERFSIPQGFSNSIYVQTVSSQRLLSALLHCTEVRLDSLHSGGFTTMVVINPPERKLAKRTSVHWFKLVYVPYGQNIEQSNCTQNNQEGIKYT